MSEVVERIKTSWRSKAACWVLASLAVVVALVGCIISANGYRTGVAAVLIAVSSVLAIGLCVVLLHRYDKQVDQTRAILYRRILHGLMLHALFVAIAALVHAVNGAQQAMVSLAVAVALADAALAATMVLLLAGVRRNWDGAGKIWVWTALLLGVVVFTLHFFGVEWIIWALIAAASIAVIIYALCKPRTCNDWCSLVFALAVAVLAIVLLIGGYVPKTHLILHVLCLILTPIYAFAAVRMCTANQARSLDASDPRSVHNGKTVIYSHAAANPADDPALHADTEEEEEEDLLDRVVASEETMIHEQESPHPATEDDPSEKNAPELADIQEKMLVWKTEGESPDAHQSSTEKDMTIPSKAAPKTNTKKTVSSKEHVSELNCDMAFTDAYRRLSLKELSTSPLKAFSGISEAQVKCMDEFGVHTIADLAALPMYRVAEQIVSMASREQEDKAVD